MKRKTFGFSLFDCDGLSKSWSSKPLSATTNLINTINCHPPNYFGKSCSPFQRIKYCILRLLSLIWYPSISSLKILQASFIPVGDRHFIPQAQLRSSFERKAQSIWQRLLKMPAWPSRWYSCSASLSARFFAMQMRKYQWKSPPLALFWFCYFSFTFSQSLIKMAAIFCHQAKYYRDLPIRRC